jgi:hypothetical protein
LHVETFCPYVLAHPARAHDADIVRRVSAVHSAIHRVSALSGAALEV